MPPGRSTFRSLLFVLLEDHMNICRTAITVLGFLSLPLTAIGAEQALSDRFFLLGSGEMHLSNERNNRSAHVRLLDGMGRIDEEELSRVDYVFGFPTREKNEHISPRMLFMLSYFADRFAPGATIHIESAYRSPEYNDKIRQQGANAARTSTHIDGMALDFWIEGVDGKMMWETIRAENCCGVGHYGGKSIHLDAGRPRFWEAATSGTGDPEPDHNRHIYVSPLYDRYLAGETVQLALSSISVFDFGIRSAVRLVATGVNPPPPSELPLTVPSASDGECMHIDTRAATRALTFTLPDTLPTGRYQVEVGFCDKPFAKMPSAIVSREIEVVSGK